MQSVEALLMSNPVFQGLEPHYCHIIAENASFAHYERDDTLFREGNEATRFYIILEGRVALETFAAQRGTLTIESIEVGEILGWSWLFPPYRWHFSARAVEPVQVIVLDGARVHALGEADHDFGYELMKRVTQIVMQRLQATRLRLLDLYGFRA